MLQNMCLLGAVKLSVQLNFFLVVLDRNVRLFCAFINHPLHKDNCFTDISLAGINKLYPSAALLFSSLANRSEEPAIGVLI